jgi:signal transduction histidine kinase
MEMIESADIPQAFPSIVARLGLMRVLLGRIEILAAPKDELVEVSVSDTGVGIAPEDQEAIFEEFRQVGTADKKAEGTGLGLTLCRKFVELHGGLIWVKSQVGAGSTFTFTIPVRRGD